MATCHGHFHRAHKEKRPEDLLSLSAPRFAFQSHGPEIAVHSVFAISFASQRLNQQRRHAHAMV